MSKVTINIEVTQDRFEAVMKALFGSGEPGIVSSKVEHEDPVIQKALPVLKKDLLNFDANSYRRAPGPNPGRIGHPHKLTDEGIAKVWELHQAGFKNAQISRAFKGIIGPEAVRRLVAKIKDS